MAHWTIKKEKRVMEQKLKVVAVRENKREIKVGGRDRERGGERKK